MQDSSSACVENYAWVGPNRGVVLLNVCRRIFSVLASSSSSSTAVSAASLDAGSSSTGACCLPPAVVRELFIQLLLLSPQLACAELKRLLLQVLQDLVTTGELLWPAGKKQTRRAQQQLVSWSLRQYACTSAVCCGWSGVKLASASLLQAMRSSKRPCLLSSTSTSSSSIAQQRRHHC